ncbi:MAG: DUF5627 domain-containing protein [Bacteroidales bacterium]|nr:DUF5627 domain-containing protein [Bacteroidales bacterium]
MKAIKYIVLPALILVMISCNQENDFADFDYTSVSFPLQYPMRVLSMGDDEIDNELDKQLKFNIAATLSGVYENKNTYEVTYEFDNSLADSLVTENGDTLVPLPDDFYLVRPTGSVMINEGERRGMIDVQLTNDFLDDPMAHKNHYVIPLVITSSTVDSILQGSALVPDPDRRNTAHWSIQPKDFVLFGIKYINEYHGTYLQRGAYAYADTVIHYRDDYVVKDKVVNLSTAGRNVVTMNGYRNLVFGDPVIPQLKITIDNNGTAVVASADSATLVFSGSGQYVVDGDEWGGEKRDVLYLQYQYNDAGVDYTVNDTLVFRSRDMSLEMFKPVL